jgi:hypothetical protein
MDERWQSMEQADRRAWLMARMMRRLGVTVAGASQASLRIALRWACRTCMSCKHTSECEAWLSHSNTASAADAPEFCPNARLFRRLRASTLG